MTSKVPEVIHHTHFGAQVWPDSFAEPLLYFFVCRKVKAFVWGYGGSHVVQVLVGGVECFREVARHVAARGHDQDVVS